MYYIKEGYFVHFAKLNKVYRKMCYQAVEEYRFTANEIEVMMFLANNPGLDTASDIAGYKNISKGLVAKSVDSLCRSGYLATQKDTRDRRVIHLILTEQSAPVVERLKHGRTEFINLLQAGVEPADLEAMERATEQMNKNLNEMLGRIK